MKWYSISFKLWHIHQYMMQKTSKYEVLMWRFCSRFITFFKCFETAHAKQKKDSISDLHVIYKRNRTRKKNILHTYVNTKTETPKLYWTASKQASQSAIENPFITKGKKNDNQIFIGQIDCENIRLAYILNKSRDLMHLSTDDAHSSQTAHLAADVDVSLNVKRLQELNKYFHAYYVKLNIFIGYCRANKLENCSSNNLFTITVKAFWFKTLGKFINQLC